MKLQFVLISLVLPVLIACPPREPNVLKAEQESVSEQQEQYAIAQPVPRFDYSLERDLVIQTYRFRNENIATHTVWRSDMGIVEGDCPSVGYPIPYDTSLTNPYQPIWDSNHQGVSGVVVGMPEPNGLFASQNSIATWVRCVVPTPTGSIQEVPVYIESTVTAYPYPVTVDYDTNRVRPVDGASPSVAFE